MGKMCAKAINPLGTRTKEQAFQITSTGLIPILTSLPDMRDSKLLSRAGLGNRKTNVRFLGRDFDMLPVTLITG